jgi:hypothetical protein
MKKQFALTKEQLKNLPEEIQNKVQNTLKAFSECSVIYENGKYNISTAICLMAKYPKDHKFIGIFYQEDIYTIEERTENYINTFRDYPIWYKGKRDYAALKERFAE